MYTVVELSQESGINAHTIRYYIRSGLLSPSKTQENSYRLFSIQAVQQVKFIYQAKRLGLAQKDIHQILATGQGGGVLPENSERMIYRLLEEHIRTVEEDIKDRQRLCNKIQLALEQCQETTGQTSNENKVECLIGAIANI